MSKSAAQFHTSCDKFKPTVTVAHNSLNHTFGGFVRLPFPPPYLAPRAGFALPLTMWTLNSDSLWRDSGHVREQSSLTGCSQNQLL
jgi:hypothetical protein